MVIDPPLWEKNRFLHFCFSLVMKPFSQSMIHAQDILSDTIYDEISE